MLWANYERIMLADKEKVPENITGPFIHLDAWIQSAEQSDLIRSFTQNELDDPSHTLTEPFLVCRNGNMLLL